MFKHISNTLGAVASTASGLAELVNKGVSMGTNRIERSEELADVEHVKELAEATEGVDSDSITDAFTMIEMLKEARGPKVVAKKKATKKPKKKVEDNADA